MEGRNEARDKERKSKRRRFSADFRFCMLIQRGRPLLCLIFTEYSACNVLTNSKCQRFEATETVSRFL